MSYASIQAIREGAGLLQRVDSETPDGAVDNSNRVFVVGRRPIVDGNYDDVVGIEDIQVRVNDVPATVDSVDADAGSFTLHTAPALNADVVVDYYFSPITDDYVTEKQGQADSWIDLKIGGYVTVPIEDDIPGVLTTAAEMYAAGLILTRDWGSRVDSEQTSKDGFAKIKQARDLVADYIQGIKDDRARKNAVVDTSVSVAGDPDVFGRCYNEDIGLRGDNTDDDFFMRRQ